VCAPAAQAAAETEPLALSGVSISPTAAEAITTAWSAMQHQSLYSSGQQLVELVEQVRPV